MREEEENNGSSKKKTFRVRKKESPDEGKKGALYQGGRGGTFNSSPWSRKRAFFLT